MKIAFLNQKGGVGKTSVSVAVAAELARRGGRVLLIDADPQGSALDWSAERAKLDPAATAQVVVVGVPRASIHTQIGAIGDGYDHILIDGPARVGEISGSAAMAADVVIVPVTPSQYDIWASEEIIKIIAAAGVYKPIKAAFLLNRKIANTTIAKEVHAALSDYPIPVLESQVTQRVIFAQSASTGRAVYEIEPNGPATAEIESLTNEILEMLK